MGDLGQISTIVVHQSLYQRLVADRHHLVDGRDVVLAKPVLNQSVSYFGTELGQLCKVLDYVGTLLLDGEI